ncbi:restriction endonuclease subunit S [Fulvivirga maritima]|uniref:restriction endonuclease subunit S n=1 Tax=Fulvivirga maritima TaxID=2904247 RepID=UPI001F33CF90|nr:restriction endonuclease subunit S [Fulvivirga maritima]UII27596.1 restriction endonuclease subunit S [Fulvivirga maritima]
MKAEEQIMKSVESINPSKSVIQTKEAAKATFQKYQAYKDSGEVWLGEIPKEWELTRLGTRFSERRSKVSDKDFPPLSVTKSGIVPQLDNAAKSNDGDNRKLVKEGDFVINSRSDRKGSSGIALEDGSVSLINIVMTPKGINPLYCNYLLKSTTFVEENYRIGHGIVADLWTTRYDEMKNIKVAIPSLPEQTAIANFLDDKTAKIDQAIAQKEKMITLLKERKQVIIQNAVTKGLNHGLEGFNDFTEKQESEKSGNPRPSVIPTKMKDSGVEWIGVIPEHWEVTQIKKIAKTTSGSTPQSGNVERYYNGSIPWVRTTDLNNDELLDTPVKITEAAIRDTACSLMPINTVCVAMYGGPGTIGKHSILRFSGAINQALCGIMPSKVLNQEYLYYYVKFYRPHWMFVAKGSRVDPNISQDEVKKMFIPLLPVYEQEKIAAFIESQSEKIGKAIMLQQTQIEKLKEYKATLIDSAVTGKIKVSF